MTINQKLLAPMFHLTIKHVEIGFIEIGKHSIIGANTTVLPNVTFHEGAAVGAQL